jgi:hypothetical protein
VRSQIITRGPVDHPRPYPQRRVTSNTIFLPLLRHHGLTSVAALRSLQSPCISTRISTYTCLPLDRQLWVSRLQPLSSLCVHLLETRNYPLGALPRLHAHQIHGVNLFERASLALDDKEVYDESAQNVCASEDVSVPEIDRASNERRKESQEKVPVCISQRPYCSCMMMKYQSQLLAVDNAIAFARYREG